MASNVEWQRDSGSCCRGKEERLRPRPERQERVVGETTIVAAATRGSKEGDPPVRPGPWVGESQDGRKTRTRSGGV